MDFLSIIKSVGIPAVIIGVWKVIERTLAWRESRRKEDVDTQRVAIEITRTQIEEKRIIAQTEAEDEARVDKKHELLLQQIAALLTEERRRADILEKRYLEREKMFDDRTTVFETRLDIQRKRNNELAEQHEECRDSLREMKDEIAEMNRRFDLGLEVTPVPAKQT